jgi:replicative DNA helicase
MALSASEAAAPTHPSDEEEESVLGGILLHPSTFDRVAEILQPDDFYHPARKAIYESMQELAQASTPIDYLTVRDKMRALETLARLNQLGGGDYLIELQNRVVSLENIEQHARSIADKATARKIVHACQEIAAKGRGDYGDVDKFIDEAEHQVFEIAQRKQKTTFEPIKPILKDAIKALAARYERKQAITGVPTSFTKFDDMTAGLQPGDLVIIAARPSMGKTSLVMNMCQNAALEHKIPGLVFSLEMSKVSLAERLLCTRARVDSGKLRRGMLDTRDWVQITKAASDISEAPIFIDDSGAPTLLEIRAKCRRWRADARVFPADKPEQLGMVVIDYLQLIQGRPAKDDSRQREISEISRGLKSLAKELRVPIIALSQLNRAVESRDDKRPRMSDLRESGAIEQDADVICFIYRDEVYNPETEDKGVAEVIIGKQRNGATGTVRLAFLGTYTRFENLAEGRAEG